MMRFVVCLWGFLACLWGQEAPRIFYSKSFPGSAVPYVEILLSRDGDVDYREEAGDDRPLRLRLDAEETEAVFLLAAKLDHFARPLESGLKVARMGEKTYRWLEDAKTNEVRFNYSQDADALALQNWFERITETARLYSVLERSLKFDRLGVDSALIRLHAAHNANRLVSRHSFLPLLDRIIQNESYINMARDRAALLKAAFEKNRQSSKQ